MAAPADVIFVDGEIHTLGTPDRIAEAIAVRNGTICRVADTYEVEFLEGINTRRVELDGRTVVPGFVDGYSHLLRVGFRLQRADLRGTKSLTDALQRLRRDAAADREWVLGFGFDETQWPESARPTATELDSVSETRPVAAFRRDMETVALNSAGLGAVSRFGSKPTAGINEPLQGVLTGQDAERVWRMISPESVEEAREYIDAAFAHAHERGVTTVVDTVRDPVTARVYHQLAVDQELPLRVRVNYQIPADRTSPDDGSLSVDRSQSVENAHLSALEAGRALGLVSGVGTGPLRIDSVGLGVESSHTTAVAEFIRAATKTGFRVTVDVRESDTVAAVIDAIQEHDAVRPRISYSGVMTDQQHAALAAAGAVVVGQVTTPTDAEPSNATPDEDGTRKERTPRFAQLLAGGVPFTFRSNGFAMTPLQDIEAVRHAGPDHQLAVTDAFRAAAGGGDNPMGPGNGTGTLEVGAPADFVVLSASPWETSLSDVSVETTVVDGSIRYES